MIDKLNKKAKELENKVGTYDALLAAAQHLEFDKVTSDDQCIIFHHDDFGFVNCWTNLDGIDDGECGFDDQVEWYTSQESLLSFDCYNYVDQVNEVNKLATDIVESSGSETTPEDTEDLVSLWLDDDKCAVAPVILPAWFGDHERQLLTEKVRELLGD